MSEDPDYILDIRSLDSPSPEQDNAPGGAGGEAAPVEGRPWIGIRFDCCGVYTRIYRNPEGTAYVGNCPRCTRQLRVAVGPGGTSHRMFRAE